MPSAEKSVGNLNNSNFRPVIAAVKDTRPYFTLELRGEVIKALCDTGAIYSYLGPAIGDRLRHLLLPSDAAIIGATGITSRVQGMLPLMFVIEGKRRLLSMRIMPHLDCPCILGLDFLRTFGIQLDLRKKTWRSGDSREHSFGTDQTTISIQTEAYASLQALT